ncbi:serine/threonine protein kinase [Ideonella livida]|uniref:HDOD domain-containing protein n=1 Tax=Ideonella livida TaxID=2707176 RepID=A0A7C9PEK7_9BURK|nr:serine/threonine protein kinase [Ideonella livida]NDY89592.1 HDOD domain-containing protein [Ideonella livida]
MLSLRAAPAAAVPRSGHRVGRFELRQVLGRGAQAVVWSAWDPTLEREVALKILQDEDEQTAALWLDEARVMGAVSHPGIVTVHEAFQTPDPAAPEQQRTVMVMELVRGQTLAERLRSQPCWPAAEAVDLLIALLEALEAAHAAGVVHRDLKPSNVLLGQDGRCRVMDFGIAARLGRDHRTGEVMGTAGYLSPEAAAGQAPSAAMDVFAAGMLLGRLLTGRALLQESDPQRYLQRVQGEDIGWPEGAPAVDDRLRGLVLRAVARRPEDRWPDAASLCQALRTWRQPAPAAPHAHGTVDFLLRRIRHAGDFPALSDAIVRIQHITTSDKESLQSLAAEVLKDVALTQKLLRMANTAHFRFGARGEVSTVTRAAALIGFAGIRNMALSLLLLEHMGDQDQAQRMRQLFAQALLTAVLTDQLTPGAREREEAFLAGMLSHLGGMLVSYYLPQEALALEMRGAGALGEPAPDIERDVLGISLDELGQAVTSSWGLPEGLRHAFSRPQGDPPTRRLEAPAETMRWRIRAASELARQVVLQGRQSDTERLLQMGSPYLAVLGLGAEDLRDALQVSRTHHAELSRVLKLPTEGGAATAPVRPAKPAGTTATGGAGRIATGSRGGDVTGPRTAVAGAGLVAAAEADAPTLRLPRPVSAAPATPMTSMTSTALAGGHDLARLHHGIVEVTTALSADRFKLNEVLGLILHTMHQGLGLDRVVFCLRDPRSGQLLGRSNVGAGGDGLQQRIHVDLGQPADLFSHACLQGVDTVVEDLHSLVAGGGRLPPWWPQADAPRGLLLLPLMLKSRPFALFYAEHDQPLLLAENHLHLLKTLRNQAVMAFKTAV